MRTLAGVDGYPSVLGRGAIEVDVWLRLREDDGWLVDELVPRTLGAAASLDALSAMLDGTRAHAAVLWMAIAGYGVAGAAVWSIVLTRFARTRPPGLSAAWQTIRQLGRPMLGVSMVAALAAVLLYVTLHPLLMNVLYPVLTAEASARTALAVRGSLYVIFGFALVTVSTLADLSRARLVFDSKLSITSAIASAWWSLRQWVAPVAGIAAVLLVLNLFLILGYAATEVIAGARAGGWRAVAAGQLYIVIRIALRLLWGTSLVALTESHLHARSR
jgi:hypothetical protein